MVQQEGGEVLDLIVVGMLTEVDDLRHGLDFSDRLQSLVIAELSLHDNAPKEGVMT